MPLRCSFFPDRFATGPCSILEQLDRHVTKRLVRKILHNMGEVPRRKACVSVFQVEINWWFASDFVQYVCIAQRNRDVVLPVSMQQRPRMRSNLHAENLIIPA